MSSNPIYLHQNPYRLDLISSLSSYYEAINENSSSPFPKNELEGRVYLVQRATKACKEVLSNYFEKKPPLFKPSYKKPISEEPSPSSQILEALDLEIPFLNSKPQFSIDEKLYLKVKAPKNDLQAKVIGLKVSKFTKDFLSCLTCSTLTYRGIKQVTTGLHLPEKYLLYLPRKASFFASKILQGDGACTISEPFAKGANGVVRKFEHKGVVFAKKEYARYDSPQSKAEFFHEIGANLVLPPCKEIVSLEAVFPNGLILEYTEKKTLLEVRDSATLLTQRIIKKHLLTLASALEKIHERGFVHTDVKPNNILCFGEDDVKLADLGYMKIIGSDQRWLSSPFSTPPEKFLKGSIIEPSGDIWALGALAFTLLTKKRTPFASDDIKSLAEYQKILVEKNLEKEVTKEILLSLLSEQQLTNLQIQDPDGSILSLIVICMSGKIHRRPSAKELKAILASQVESKKDL